MNSKKLKASIEAFRKLNAETVLEPTLAEITAADIYDIRTIVKAEAKKLTAQDLMSLIEYGNSYKRLYESGVFMTRKTRDGRALADLDEAQAYQDISKNVAMLTNLRGS
jgi:hypothetical protein